MTRSERRRGGMGGELTGRKKNGEDFWMIRIDNVRQMHKLSARSGLCTPKGLSTIAQGRDRRELTLGHAVSVGLNPEGVAALVATGGTPSGFDPRKRSPPRVGSLRSPTLGYQL